MSKLNQQMQTMKNYFRRIVQPIGYRYQEDNETPERIFDMICNNQTGNAMHLHVHLKPYDNPNHIIVYPYTIDSQGGDIKGTNALWSLWEISDVIKFGSIIQATNELRSGRNPW